MTTTYTVSAGSTDEYHPRYVDSETLTICENYARSWISRGPFHWAEIISDDTAEVVQYYHQGEEEEHDR